MINSKDNNSSHKSSEVLANEVGWKKFDVLKLSGNGQCHGNSWIEVASTHSLEYYKDNYRLRLLTIRPTNSFDYLPR